MATSSGSGQGLKRLTDRYKSKYGIKDKNAPRRTIGEYRAEQLKTGKSRLESPQTPQNASITVTQTVTPAAAPPAPAGTSAPLTIKETKEATAAGSSAQVDLRAGLRYDAIMSAAERELRARQAAAARAADTRSVDSSGRPVRVLTRADELPTNTYKETAADRAAALTSGKTSTKISERPLTSETEVSWWDIARQTGYSVYEGAAFTLGALKPRAKDNTAVQAVTLLGTEIKQTGGLYETGQATTDLITNKPHIFGGRIVGSYVITRGLTTVLNSPKIINAPTQAQATNSVTRGAETSAQQADFTKTKIKVSSQSGQTAIIRANTRAVTSKDYGSAIKAEGVTVDSAPTPRDTNAFLRNEQTTLKIKTGGEIYRGSSAATSRIVIKGNTAKQAGGVSTTVGKTTTDATIKSYTTYSKSGGAATTRQTVASASGDITGGLSKSQTWFKGQLSDGLPTEYAVFNTGGSYTVSPAFKGGIAAQATEGGKILFGKLTPPPINTGAGTAAIVTQQTTSGAIVTNQITAAQQAAKILFAAETKAAGTFAVGTAGSAGAIGSVLKRPSTKTPTLSTITTQKSEPITQPKAQPVTITTPKEETKPKPQSTPVIITEGASDTERKPRISSRIGSGSDTRSRSIFKPKTDTTPEQIPKTQPDLIQTPEQIPRTVTAQIPRGTGGGFAAFTPPVLPPASYFPKASAANSAGGFGFGVFVRRGGRFVRASGDVFSKRDALNFGRYVVSNTAAASFKIKPEGRRPTRKFRPFGRENDFYASRRESGVFIEKKSRRLKSLRNGVFNYGL